MKKKGQSAGVGCVQSLHDPHEAAKQPGRIRPTSAERRRAWLVHAFTGSGAIFAFIAGWGVIHGYDRLALAALFTATIVDGVDGMLARRARVKEVLPEIDGGRIDDIVDYMTFVLIPCCCSRRRGALCRAAFPSYRSCC